MKEDDMHAEGYYRAPTLWQQKIVFVADDDLWVIPASGGKAERLTAGTSDVNDPVFSPDGKWIAFTGAYEGHTEVYVVPAEGGEAKRLTYISEGATVVGWASKNKVIFSSTKNDPFRMRSLYTVDLDPGSVEKIPCGPANFISYNPNGKGAVIQRHGYGYVSWKRYRGGTAGDLWIDTQGDGNFTKLIDIKGNALRPLWVGGRIYFMSDHEGHGNIYSCTPKGEDLKRHTSHEDYFVRSLSHEGDRFVYTAGGDVYTFSPQQEKSQKLAIDFRSSFTQRARKFVDPTSYLSTYALNTKGDRLAVVTRGRPFTFANWEGAVEQYGERDGVRYKSVDWLHDDKQLVIVSDRDGKDVLEIHSKDPLKKPKILTKLDLGRIHSVVPSPTQDEIVLTNHKGELFHVNLKTEKARLIESSTFEKMGTPNWSPDGKWIVYDFPISRQLRAIKLCEIKTFKTHVLTRPVLQDFQPVFEPEGKYIYFLSARTYTPYPDNFQFEFSFPKGIKPCLILLQPTLTSPFIPLLREEEELKKPKKETKKEGTETKDITIDLKGIQDRILEFPVPEGNYLAIVGVPGKALYLSRPFLTAASGEAENHKSPNNLECYDFGMQKGDTLISNLSSFTLSKNSQCLAYYGNRQLRVIKAGEKPQDNDPSYRKGGVIDLARLKVSVDPFQEWCQMFEDSWRLQKEFFWTADMSKIDWEAVYKHYSPLLKRIATRGELSDLIGEMHGELGTSHAYVMGGDMRQPPRYPLGELGADFVYDKREKAYRITNMTEGDRWNPNCTSPLNSPGLGLEEGSLVLTLNGQRLDEETFPEKLLVNQAGNMVSLGIKDGKNKMKTVNVRTLSSQTPARYRDWVDANRAYVHKKTKGRLGYIHIPDMSIAGFAEFHRGFLAEVGKEGLIVDVRFNGGGNVSGLLLEKLSRKRLGYDRSRWWGDFPYPFDSPAGPMVALTNEYAGSDGDIFTHSFKMLKLGPVIGKRTWGGVIGIWPRNPLMDGGQTTQPEFSFWFHDVGWKVENYGVDPDIEVEISPQDYVKGRDPQLDRGIKEALAIVAANPPQKPCATERPNLVAPKLKRKHGK